MKRALTLALAVAAVAFGQEKKTLPLSLAKAVEIATAPDGATRVRLAIEQVKAAEARRAQARSALLPNVDGSYTFRNFTNNLQTFGIQFPPTLPFQIQLPALAGPLSVNDERATGTQSIFDLSAIKRYQASKAQVSAAKADNDAAISQTKGTVAKAYLDALRAEAALDTAKANVQLAERVLAQAKSQKQAGTGTGIDVTRSEVSLANEHQREIAAREDLHTARLNLMRAMGLDLGVELQLTESMKYVPAEIPEPGKALVAARELRPELKAQAQRERAARLNFDSVKDERLPSVNAFGDYGVVGKTDSIQLPTRTIGVSVKFPLWDGGRRDARRVESASLLRQEGIRTHDTAQQVELEVRLAIESLESADNQVKVTLEAQAQSEKELAQAERRFDAGVAIGLEVTEAQARVARSRENQVSALFKQKSARIDLGLAVGNIDLMIE